MTPSPPQLAVLIDGNNLSALAVERLLREAEKLGILRLKRVYRNWSHAGDDWMAMIAREGIRAARCKPCTGRKNGSDIAMTVEAMKMLGRGIRDFCLFSSDSDFTPLALELRKGGARVYGFGEDKTPLALKEACNRFIVLPPDPRRVQADARRALLKLMRELAGDGGEVDPARIGDRMKTMGQAYGYGSLKKLIAATDGVEMTAGKVRLRKTG